MVPTIDPFEVHTEFEGDVAEMTLTGKLDMSTFVVFQTEVESVLAKKPSRLVLNLQDLDSIANVGIRVLLFARQRMDISDRADIYAVAPKPVVKEALMRADPDQEDINVVESYDPFRDPDGSASARTDRPPAPAGGAGRRALRQAPAGTCSRPSSARRTSRNASVTPGMAGR